MSLDPRCCSGPTRLRHVLRTCAGWPGAGSPSSRDAAFASTGAQSEVAKDTWRALEALLRLTAGDVILGDVHLLQQQSDSDPEYTYHTMVRCVFVAMQGCANQVLGLRGACHLGFGPGS